MVGASVLEVRSGVGMHHGTWALAHVGQCVQGHWGRVGSGWGTKNEKI